MLLLLLTIGLLQGCTNASPSTPTQSEQKPPVAVEPQSPAPESPITEQPPSPTVKPPTEQPDPQATVYANDIFQNVTVKKTAEDTFEIKGQARVFEAVLHYVVEDGHNELTQGFVQASTAAPDWGDFTHTLKVKKAEPNSTLTLILFETSMKDGSRRMELIIPLPEK